MSKHTRAVKRFLDALEAYRCILFKDEDYDYFIKGDLKHWDELNKDTRVRSVIDGKCNISNDIKLMKSNVADIVVLLNSRYVTEASLIKTIGLSTINISLNNLILKEDINKVLYMNGTAINYHITPDTINHKLLRAIRSINNVDQLEINKLKNYFKYREFKKYFVPINSKRSFVGWNEVYKLKDNVYIDYVF